MNAEYHEDIETGRAHAEAEAERPTHWTVAVYLADRQYGGPEEGGWWYDCGERVNSGPPGSMWLRVFTDEGAAYRHAESLQRLLDSEDNNDGQNRDLGSVNCVGRYVAHVYAGDAPKYYPEITPHYE